MLNFEGGEKDKKKLVSPLDMDQQLLEHSFAPEMFKFYSLSRLVAQNVYSTSGAF
jgi:hypothetical protein